MKTIHWIWDLYFRKAGMIFWYGSHGEILHQEFMFEHWKEIYYEEYIKSIHE